MPDAEIKQRSRYVPNVIEPASGLTRAVLVLLCEAYTVEARAGVERFEYFRFKPQQAAEQEYEDTCEASAEKGLTDDETTSIAESVEVGEATIDGDTAKDNSVTIRERDTQAQVRVSLDKVEAYIRERL